MKCRARVLYRRGRGCVTGSHRSLGFTVPSGPGEPVLVPEGGGPPARSPHASLRLGVVDLEARPGPAAALRHPGMHLGPPAPSTLVAWVCRGRPGPAAALRHRGCGCVAGVPGAVGPARPLAVRAASLRLGASARSPARPCGPDGTLHTGGGGVSWAARPCRRPQAPGNAPWPAGTLHTGGAGVSWAARPCRRPQAPRLWLRRWCSGCRRARPPARRPRREPAARRVGSKPGQALRSRRHPPHWWRGCVAGGQTRTWRIHGLGAELPCTRRRVRKCDGLNVSEPTEHSTIARGAHAVE